MASSAMRGAMISSILRQTFDRHGVIAHSIDSRRLALVLRTPNITRGRFICVLLKYSHDKVADICRQHGAAYVLMDTIDNHRAFEESYLHSGDVKGADAFLVQTREHASWLAKRGLRAVVMPHPHGNVNGWGVDRGFPHRPLRGVGFVVDDLEKNLPEARDLNWIRSACCRANATLYVVHTKNGHMRFIEWGAHVSKFNLSRAGIDGRGCEAERNLLAEPAREACEPVDCSSSSEVDDWERRVLETGMVNAWKVLADDASQQRYYDTPEVLLDVGLMWWPAHQVGNEMARRNRPPTRMHWWWAHGIPTFGAPMQAYVEATQRAGYPTELLNLRTRAHVEQALCQLSQPATRNCLRRSALRGALFGSPQFAALELLAAACDVLKSCRNQTDQRGEDM